MAYRYSNYTITSAILANALLDDQTIQKLNHEHNPVENLQGLRRQVWNDSKRKLFLGKGKIDHEDLEGQFTLMTRIGGKEAGQIVVTVEPVKRRSSRSSH